MFSLDAAYIYDIETFPNCFTLACEALNSDEKAVWEISDYRDDRKYLTQWFNWLHAAQIPMIGFNNLGFDYPVIHEFWMNPNASVTQLYDKAMTIINSFGRGNHQVWADKRLTPQIDLYKMYHFDNKAKSTSLKWLQINMRSETVVDMPVPNGTQLSLEQVDHYLKPYNVHDVTRTKDFTKHSMTALEFRASLVEEFGVDVMNWNDTKIGEQKVINKLGKDLCYDYSSGRRQTRQTPRTHINLKDVIFPYIQFEQPEFNRVLNYLKSQTLTHDEYDEKKIIKTKGVFKDLVANVGGIGFHFGVGGIHGSVERKSFKAGNGWIIEDIDVASLYPSVAIANRLSPAHLGEPFVNVYSELPRERKEWQKKLGKKCVQANALKLASNGVYGKSNSAFSPFYDPQFTMTITINGQLMLCMLAEQLIKVPTLQLIQINTDGITYTMREEYRDQAVAIWRWWEQYTGLVLEDVLYSEMYIRDVNSYIAVGTDGSVKLKGAYWTPDPLNYHKSISEQQPPAWHKNLSNAVSARAAVLYMTQGVDVETYIKSCMNPYDFMIGLKVTKADNIMLGEQEIQRTSRYYVAKGGQPLTVQRPPTGKPGAPKKNSKVSEQEYLEVMNQNGWQWDERVCTKNKSVHSTRVTAKHVGYLVNECNDVRSFDFSKVDYDFYIAEASKLIV